MSIIYSILKFLIKQAQALFEFVPNYVILTLFRVNYASFPDIRGVIFIRNHGLIKIGEKVIFNCKLSANPVGGPYETSLCVSEGASLIIGSNVGISSTAIICNVGISIGSNTKIGSGCRIYDTDFHSIDFFQRCESVDLTVKELPVSIGEGVFIGAGSIVLKGVTIGDYSIIGAGSVVSKNIPANEIWAGNPAKFIRKLSDSKLI